MRGGGMDMQGGNFRGNDNWGNRGGSMNIPCVHMRGLPFRATEQDIGEVSL